MVNYTEEQLTPEEHQLLKDFKDTKVYDPATYHATINRLADAIVQGFGTVPEYGTEENILATLMELNVNRFGFDKNVAQISELNRIFRNTKNYSDFKKEAINLVKNYNHNYLRTEYDVAYSSAQNGARWLGQKKHKNTFPYLKYVTAGDNRVREEHQALNGKIFSMNNYDKWDFVYPPNGYRCRCMMVAIRPDEVDQSQLIDGDKAKELLGSEYEIMKKQGFDKNPGETGQIFVRNNAYVQRLKNNETVKINDLTHEDSGLKSFDIVSKTKTETIVPGPETPDDLKKLFNEQKKSVNGKDYLIFKDYQGREMGIDKDSFTAHSKKTGRAEVFKYVDTVLKNPDEVFITSKSEKLFNYTYVKNYNDGQICVVANIDDKLGMTFETWFKTRENLVDKYRKGILIKKGGF